MAKKVEKKNDKKGEEKKVSLKPFGDEDAKLKFGLEKEDAVYQGE